MEWFENKYPARHDYLIKAKRIKTRRGMEDYKELLEAMLDKNFDKLVVPYKLILYS
jgi:hypothetical protein